MMADGCWLLTADGRWLLIAVVAVMPDARAWI
jgi:hypothetical protein